MKKRKEQGQGIIKSINQYAEAYKNLEDIQCQEKWLIKGDQKTGVIGEFYTFVYLRNKYKKAEIKYANHSQKGWDIKIEDGGKTIKAQIKTVSEYSKTRVISPIHSGWDELYLVYLDKQFDPKEFWIINDPKIVKKGNSLKGKKMPIRGNGKPGSEVFKKREDLFSELTTLIGRFKRGRLKPPD